MATSHADSHDLNKLARWYEGLCVGDSGRFPVHAIFLVSAEDRAAHDVFRKFRSSFEAHAAQFHHLVIFGQHGVSATVKGLLPEFGLHIGSLPVLVLLSKKPSATTVCVLPLPGGRGRESQSLEGRRWMDVLAGVEKAAERGEEAPDVASLPGLTIYQLGNRSLVDLVGGVLKGLS